MLASRVIPDRYDAIVSPFTYIVVNPYYPALLQITQDL